MVTRRNPLTSALSLVVAFLALAGSTPCSRPTCCSRCSSGYTPAPSWFWCCSSSCCSTARIGDAPKPLGAGRFAIGALVVAAAAVKGLAVLGGVQSDLPEVDARFGSVAGVAEVLFTRYVLQFEIVSILLWP